MQLMDTVSSKIRSATMRSIKSQGSNLENDVNRALWRKGIRYRKNVRNLMGNPDIAIKKYKIVVFVDSCFWHGCQKHFRMPKSNNEYWDLKIERNKLRDREVNRYYKVKGWFAFRIWEHQLKDNFDKTIEVLSRSILMIYQKHNVKSFL